MGKTGNYRLDELTMLRRNALRLSNQTRCLAS